MLFNRILGIEKVDKTSVRVKTRDAVRAVIIKEDKILLVHVNTGEYKFPGGGVKRGESQEAALKREVEEETAYVVSKVEHIAGIIIERNMDSFEKDAIFEMTSNYYFCETFEIPKQQKLDAYEAALGFKAEWVNITQAINNNEEVLKGKNVNPWVYRETLVLRELQKK